MIEPTLIYTLRTAGRPVGHESLRHLYDSEVAFAQDLATLRRKGLIHESTGGLQWTGS